MEYLWGGQLGHVRARVAWNNCCLKLKHEGLNLIDLEAATKSLLVKWVIKAIEGDKSNRHLLIQMRSGNLRPNREQMELRIRMDVSPTSLAGTWI